MVNELSWASYDVFVHSTSLSILLIPWIILLNKTHQTLSMYLLKSLQFFGIMKQKSILLACDFIYIWKDIKNELQNHMTWKMFNDQLKTLNYLIMWLALVAWKVMDLGRKFFSFNRFIKL